MISPVAPVHQVTAHAEPPAPSHNAGAGVNQASAVHIPKLDEAGRAHQLQEQGQTPAEIAQALGVSLSSVNSDLFMGLPSNGTQGSSTASTISVKV